MNNRDELAKVIADAQNVPFVGKKQHHIADAILAAGWMPPRSGIEIRHIEGVTHGAIKCTDCGCLFGYHRTDAPVVAVAAPNLDPEPTGLSLNYKLADWERYVGHLATNDEASAFWAGCRAARYPNTTESNQT